MGAEELERSLLTVLGDVVGDGARVEGLRRLSGGASRETWSFDVVDGATRHELILQRLRPGATASSTGVAIAAEADLLRVAGEHGVPVARVVASEDGPVLGSAGMV